MLEVRDISFAYRGGAKVLDAVGFTGEPGEVIAVLGVNGSGKSTLIKCMDRILEPQSGSVSMDGRSLFELTRREHARIAAYVPQTPPRGGLTVYDAVLLGRRPYISWEASARDKEAVASAMQLLHLEPFALRQVSELSGGEQQKAAIARALAQEPRLLMLDEPTSALDPLAQHETMRLLRSITRERSLVSVVVLHDLNLAVRYCDRFLFLKDSRVFAFGGREVMTDDNIGEVYHMHVHLTEYMGIPQVVPFPEIKM